MPQPLHPSHLRVEAVADVAEAAALLAEAFREDPVVAAFVPAGGGRPRRLRAFYTALLRSGPLRGGVVEGVRDASGRLLGVAAWEAPGAAARLPAEVREVASFATAFGGARGTVGALRRQGVLARYRPRVPHWYLLTTGVRSDVRGHGVGAALLAHRLAEVDARDDPAYLESSTPRNGRLYQRYGFRPLAVVEGLPGARPTASWRPAASLRGGGPPA